MGGRRMCLELLESDTEDELGRLYVCTYVCTYVCIGN